MSEFHLHPPFFIVSEENSFPDAWEAFCCKMLNLAEKRNDIYRRTPPEDGIDLYCLATKTAYQCKSVESGKAGDFDPKKAIESIRSAVSAKSQVPWDKYVLCCNVDLTGNAEAKLRAELTDIDIRPRSYWLKACEENAEASEHHFRRLVEIPRAKTEEAVQEGFKVHYSRQLKELLKKEETTVLLYSNRHNRVYRLPVSLDFKVDDLVHIFRLFFQLPPRKMCANAGISVSLSHSLVVNGKKQTFGRTLKECGIEKDSILTYWTTVVWRDLDDETSSTTLNRLNFTFFPSAEDRKNAIEDYKSSIRAAFEQFDALIGDNQKSGNQEG